VAAHAPTLGRAYGGCSRRRRGSARRRPRAAGRGGALPEPPSL